MSESAVAHAERRPVRGDGGLSVRGLRAGYYGNSVLFDVDLDAPWGRVTALFGHNGAGKTTILRSIAGLVAVQAGSVSVDGIDVTGNSVRDMVRLGVAYLPEDHATFPGMSVLENLEMGMITVRRNKGVAERRDKVFEIFPVLAERRRSLANTLSGGQRRMLSVGMALMADARVLLLDEPSLGLSPAINQSLLAQVARFAKEDGGAVVLVEQAVGQALAVVDHVYVVRSGVVIAEMDAQAARARDDWSDVF